MAVNKRAAGADKEQLAARYLVDNGYTVLERNFRNKTGEIDIIAKKDNYIVFVEVKYRSNNKYNIIIFLCDNIYLTCFYTEVVQEQYTHYQQDILAASCSLSAPAALY